MLEVRRKAISYGRFQCRESNLQRWRTAQHAAVSAIIKACKDLVICPPPQDQGLTADLRSEPIRVKACDLNPILRSASRPSAVAYVPNVDFEL